MTDPDNLPLVPAKLLAPDYLTARLRRSGVLDRGSVLQVETRLTKRLHVSTVSRLRITYSADAPESAPANLFLKIPAPGLPDTVLSDLGKEIEFYNLIVPEMDDPPFIRCYDARYSPKSGDCYLLMEDLTETHGQPRSPVPPTSDQSESAVRSLAALHAFWWNHGALGNGVGTLFDRDELNVFVDSVESNVVSFLDFLGDSLSAEHREIYERMLASKHKIWGRLTSHNGLTVTHGDAHWWNFLYPLDLDKERVRIFDWQLWHLDLGARDLAFLIALGGFAERRKKMERHLLRCYYDSLVELGVNGYSWDDLWNDYRLSAIRNLNIPVIHWTQGRSEELWRTGIDRALRAFQELNCSEMLTE